MIHVTKNMYSFFAIFTLFFVSPACAVWPDKASYIGTLQFPKELKRVPHVRVYFRGNKLVCDVNDRAHKVTFPLETERQRTRLYVLISSDKISLVKARKADPEMEQNTIEYLKMLPTQSYKMYQLDLVKEYIPVEYDDPQTGRSITKQKAVYRWVVQEVELPESGRIPDDAIIVRLNADYIAAVEGGNGVELPRIKLKDSAVAQAGSEEKLLEEMAQLLFSSLDIDTLHASVRHEKRGDLQLKTIVAMAR